MSSMRAKLFWLVWILVVLPFGLSARTSYTNPVIEEDLPDPTVVADGVGNYFLYSTSGSKKVPIYTSRNLVDWKYCGDSFSGNQIPHALEGSAVWAPDVIKYDGDYLMAYSESKRGEFHKNGIGLAVAKSPEGPFRNQGLLFSSDEIGVGNSIDPSLIEDGGKLYLLWGSFNGIFIIRMQRNADGSFGLAKGAKKMQLAGKAFEGTHIFKRGRYYYLFASVGRCCEQEKSTYRVVVGRSKNLLGPYVDADGEKMFDNGYEFVVGSNEKFAGPGHGSSIITDKDGRTWYIYHGYLREKATKGRMVLLDELKWTKDGWPYIYKGSPSSDPTPAPRF